jgi:hypothetical protein
MTVIKMTPNQHRVFEWLQSRTNFRREVLCSARTLALAFNFSDQYAMKILEQLDELGALSLIRRGTGQRANKYRVLNPQVMVLKAKKVRIPTLPQEDLARRTTSATDERSLRSKDSSSSILSQLKNERSKSYVSNFTRSGSNSPPVRVETRLTSLSRLPRIGMAPRPAMRSPFNRFEKKKHTPDLWNAQDIVCYYALLFRHVYGSLPMISWKRDTAAAKNLINAMDASLAPPAHQVKLYLQMAFGLVKRDWHIGSLMWFTHENVMNMVLETQDMRPGFVDQAMNEYDDKYILSL